MPNNNETPDTGTLDPFARVLPFEPGDRVLVARSNGHDSVHGVVLGPTYRPRFHATLDPYTVNHEASDDNRLYDVRVVGRIGLDREEHGYGIEAVRQSELSPYKPPPGTPDVEALQDRLRDLRSTYAKQRQTYKEGAPLDRFFDGVIDGITITEREVVPLLRTLSAANAAQAASIAEMHKRLADLSIDPDSPIGVVLWTLDSHPFRCPDSRRKMVETVKNLAAQIAELEGDIAERISFESAVGQLLDEVKRRYETDVAQAAAAERKRIVAELRTAFDHEPIGGQKRWAFKVAADRLETNGREQG